MFPPRPRPLASEALRRGRLSLRPAALCATLACTLAVAGTAPGQATEDAPLRRYHATLQVQRPAPYIALPLPASAYGRSVDGRLADLRLVDSRGAAVPFSLWTPPAAVPAATPRRVPATLYPLPAQAVAEPGATGRPAMEIRLAGTEIRIDGQAVAAVAPGASAPANGAMAPAGWLIDLGQLPASATPPRRPDAVQLRWDGDADFSVVADLATSADLRQWQPAGSAALLQLKSADGTTLRQDRLPWPVGSNADTPFAAPYTRYLRLRWVDARQAPRLTGAEAWFDDRPAPGNTDGLTRLSLAPSPAPAPPHGLPPTLALPAEPPGAERALHFDLGGVLPLQRIDLALPAGNLVWPVTWQQRNRPGEAWQPLASHVHLRLERGGATTTSPPLWVDTTARYLRAVPDARMPALTADAVRLLADARLAQLVFVQQGVPPFRLLAGAVTDTPDRPQALPTATLVADIDAERPRFGSATLGDWQEDPAAARAAASAERLATWRPWLLWGVLLAGVAGLGAMVWRLSRGAR